MAKDKAQIVCFAEEESKRKITVVRGLTQNSIEMDLDKMDLANMIVVIRELSIIISHISIRMDKYVK